MENNSMLCVFSLSLKIYIYVCMCVWGNESVIEKRKRYTFHSQHVNVFGVSLGVLSYTLVFAPVTFRDISEPQAAVKHIFGGPSFWQLAIPPHPGHFWSWTRKDDMYGGIKEKREKQWEEVDIE